jgi:glycerol-3-phosphate dehydrogenase
LPAARVLDLGSDPAGKPLKPGFRKAFEFSDCAVDDARLVVLNARDAAERGALVRTRCRVVSAKRQEGHWSVILSDEKTGVHEEVKAKLIVNATGPWVDTVLADCFGFAAQRHVRLVKGSHIVIKRKFDDPRAYFFQNADGRIVFAIPYEDAFTLIGTTDEDFAGNPHGVTISEAETDYLCQAASGYFAEPVRREDIVWRYAGVRPLFDDGASKAQEATRDYVLKADDGGAGNEARLINVFGGKITTYRRLSEAVLAKVEEALGAKGASWTATAKLPGGDFEPTGFEDQVTALKRAFPFLPDETARRYTRLYGTLAGEILGQARSLADLGADFSGGLYEAELRHLVEREWARTAEDILWRRTKLGLHITGPQAVSALEEAVAGYHGADAAAPAARSTPEGKS